MDKRGLSAAAKTSMKFIGGGIPHWLAEEFRTYCSKLYGLTPDDRVFYMTCTALNKELTRCTQITYLPDIRVHDLRHSHVSLCMPATRYGYFPFVRLPRHPSLCPCTPSVVPDSHGIVDTSIVVVVSIGESNSRFRATYSVSLTVTLVISSRNSCQGWKLSVLPLPPRMNPI